jgi:hypothetical protein
MGRVRKYFGCDPKSLFEASPHLSENSNNHARVAVRSGANVPSSVCLPFGIVMLFPSIPT